MRIRNITNRRITLKLSTTVVLRPGQEKDVNSAQARKCKLYQDRGYIKILGAEGAKVQEVASKKASQIEVPLEDPKIEVPEDPAPEILENPVVESEVADEKEDNETEVVENPKEINLDALDGMEYSELKKIAGELDIKARSKSKLIEAIKDHFNNG